MDKKSPLQQSGLKQQHKDQLKKLIGTHSDSTSLRESMREHQGWWRAFVLGLPAFEYQDKNTDEWNSICNRTFEETTPHHVNFLTENAHNAVRWTLKKRNNSSKGMIQQDRLFYNLLSSQPLAFNFFGELMVDTVFGLKVLQSWWPNITDLKEVIFEYAPEEGFTGDNSAFDVSFIVMAGESQGLIGLECKYTDTFSYRPSNSKEFNSNLYYGEVGQNNFEKYNPIYLKGQPRFSKPYDDFVKSKNYNQLFRNELIAESLIQNNKFDFVRTGLFCSPDDPGAIQTGRNFQSMLTNGQEQFKIITYRDFISKVQSLDLDWNQREWTMLLWARYLGKVLSRWEDQEWINLDQQNI